MSLLPKILKAFEGVERSGLFSFQAVTEVTTLKKSRISGLPLPAELIGAVKEVRTTVSLGNDYEAAVNRRRLIEGKQADFQAKDSYAHPYKESKVVFKHKSKDQYYLRVYPNLCHSFKTEITYTDSNGKEYSKKEFEEKFSEFLPKPSQSNKNQELTEEIIVRNYKIENIVKLKHGNKEYSA